MRGLILVYVSAYTRAKTCPTQVFDTCVAGIRYMCPHTAVSVPAYYQNSARTLLYMCRHTSTNASHTAIYESPNSYM
jgi:hypothetical protein